MTAPDTGWLCSPDMTHLTAMTAAHALARIVDWQTALRAENKSPGTIFIYAARRRLNHGRSLALWVQLCAAKTSRRWSRPDPPECSGLGGPWPAQWR